MSHQNWLELTSMPTSISPRRRAYRDLFSFLPLHRASAVLLGFVITATSGTPSLSAVAGTVTLLLTAWVLLWIYRNGAVWLGLFRLARAGTPVNLLRVAEPVLRSWTTLVVTHGWAPDVHLESQPSLVVRIARQLSRSDLAQNPRVVRLEEHPAGWIAFIALTPNCGTSHITKASGTIADLWGAERVEVARSRPREASILAIFRDPLAGSQRAFPDVQAAGNAVSAEDFIRRDGDDA